MFRTCACIKDCAISRHPRRTLRAEKATSSGISSGGPCHGPKVYFQVQAASPPSYRVQFGGPEEDRPRLPDGRIPPRRVANNGSLASDDIRRYVNALIRDLFRAYPDLDGLRVDWPEYPPYFLDDLFLDFSAPAQRAAQRFGMPFERMREDALRLYKLLHGGLKPRHLAAWAEPDGGRSFLLSALINYPGDPSICCVSKRCWFPNCSRGSAKH